MGKVLHKYNRSEMKIIAWTYVFP